MSRSKNNKVKVQENNNKKKRFKILNLLTGLFLGMFLMSSAVYSFTGFTWQYELYLSFITRLFTHK